MPVVNPLARELVFKVVYYGPALSGKTTNLQQIHRIVEEESRGHLMVLNQFGSIPHEYACENIRMTAAQVLPNLRHIWNGEWEDHWWPQRLARPQAPAPLLFDGAADSVRV